LPTLSERIDGALSAYGFERKSSPGPAGGYSFGTTFVGGPNYTDAWKSKRAPSPAELVEHFKSLVFSCVITNADAVSSVPLKLYMNVSDGRKPKDGLGSQEITKRQVEHLRSTQYVGGSAGVSDIREVRDHPFLMALDQPDPQGILSRTQLLKLISMYCDTVGVAYVQPEGRVSAPYRWLWILASQYMLPVFDGSSPIPSSYNYGSRNFKPEELICFRTSLSLKNSYGSNYSPLYAAVEYAKLEDKFVSIQEQLMAQGPRPNLLVTPSNPDLPPGQDEKLRFEQDLNRKHARGAQGGVIVANGAWDVKPITYSPTDLTGLKIAEYDLERICACFGVPITLFLSETNLANLQAAEKLHAVRAVNPRCKAIADRLTQVVRQWDRRLFFAFDNAVAADRELEAKLFDMEIKNGSTTINQANQETGKPPVPWGDEPWFQNTMAQPSAIKELNQATITASTLAAVGSKEGGGSAAVGNKDAKKAKGGSQKGGSDAKRNLEPGYPDLPGVVRSLHDQADEAVLAVEGLTLEGEDGDPFAFLAWDEESRSAANG
jgi:phage portal protein BeeE